jgi:hypothetical protein
MAPRLPPQRGGVIQVSTETYAARAQHSRLRVVRNEPCAGRRGQFRRMIVARTAIAGGGPWGQWLQQRVIGVGSAASAWSTGSTTVTASRSGVVTGAFGKPNGASSQRQIRGWTRCSSSLEPIGSTGTSQPQSHAPAGQQQQRTGAASSDGDSVGRAQVSGPTSCARMRITAFIVFDTRTAPSARQFRPPASFSGPRERIGR